MVEGVQRLAPLSNALMEEIPEFTNFGVDILMGSDGSFIQHRVWRTRLELLDSFSRGTLVKMGGANRILVNCLSMEVSNLLDFFKYGVVDCRLLSISRLMLRPQRGAVAPMKFLVMVPLVPALSLKVGVGDFLIPLSIGV